MTRIAIDAMGGDHAPHEIVAGAVWGAQEYGVAIELVGKQDRIEQELDKIAQDGIYSDCATGGKPKRIKIDLNKLDIKITHASEVIEKLVKSAVANAEVKGYDPSNLYIEECFAGDGPIMKRIQPRARGTAYRIFKRMSNITVILNEKN